MLRRQFSLYLDETGDRGIVNFNPQYPVLGLCACVVDDADYQAVVPEVSNFKTRWFGTSRLTLRYSAIMKRTGPFSSLATPQQMHAFERDLAALVKRLPIFVKAQKARRPPAPIPVRGSISFRRTLVERQPDTNILLQVARPIVRHLEQDWTAWELVKPLKARHIVGIAAVEGSDGMPVAVERQRWMHLGVTAS